jgi:hypothetical protein
MRLATVLIVVFALLTAGCGKVEKEIDTPGPAPPYDPKGAALPANVTPDKPADIPLESAWNPAKNPKENEPAESDNPGKKKSAPEDDEANEKEPE